MHGVQQPVDTFHPFLEPHHDAVQVVDSLLHPATLERLQAIRRYVEQEDGVFPPAPTTADLPVPIYGYTKQQALEWWKPRAIDNISFRAIEMLYTPRQLMYYWNDMDLPW